MKEIKVNNNVLKNVQSATSKCSSNNIVSKILKK